MKTKDGRSLEAFFKLKADTTVYNLGLDKIPSAFYQPFSTLAEQELQAVKDGKKSLDEAISVIQDKGQEELTKAKQAEDAQKEKEAAAKK
ncbi:hypothetical protein [Paenibacillus hamazuiensis]|uniref:hypothetical protein n=1 Tax=Paenibacillus hamazuiensis TaxID=2936508 RepID=UPI00200BD32F|nr:hypothetical protein [Paenibacillus hamazuiensis]